MNSAFHVLAELAWGLTAGILVSAAFVALKVAGIACGLAGCAGLFWRWRKRRAKPKS